MMAWTEQMDAVLRECARNDESMNDAALKLGVTRCSVAGRAHRLGVTFHCPLTGGAASPAPQWTDEQLSYLQTHYLSKSAADIGEAIGRSESSVSTKIWHLRSAGKLGVEITGDAKDILAELSETSSITAARIAEIINGARETPLSPAQVAYTLRKLEALGVAETERRAIRRSRKGTQYIYVWRLAPQAQEIAA